MRNDKSLSAFSWFGGKTCHLDWLIPLIDSIEHKSYVEPFGGSAAILLNKSPSPIEIYNDLYGDLVNFFRVLRTEGKELVAQLQLTPYSREEFAKSCGKLEGTPLEMARLFFVRARQVRNGLASKATPGRWSYTKKDCRRGCALPISQWLGAIDGLPEICERIKGVQIENLDALDIISRYDTRETLHYIDPPYMMSTRTPGKNYSLEYSDENHVKMLELLVKLEGKVVVSGYINGMYPEVLKGWKESRRVSKLANSTLQDGEKSMRQEVIWTNFEPNLTGEGWEI